MVFKWQTMIPPHAIPQIQLKMLCQIFGRFDPNILISNSIGILMAVEKVTSFHLIHCSKKSANYS